ncbi:uncharacterized protein [Littorina saxatilis]|uniref:Uncharacterized protein n=1 Tax=Littorina saxatilis TaxID=31220 RepID=A0AAN9G661_9CAEN
MRSVACVVVVLVLCGRGDSSDKRDVDFSCCTPKAWTSQMRLVTASVTRARNEYRETWQTYHYDSENQREAWTDVIQDGHVLYSKIIVDFTKHTMTILLDTDRCKVYKIQGDFQPHCTPVNISMVLFAVAPVLSPVEGTFANTVYYGGDGVTGHMTVTVGQCALVEEAIFRSSIIDGSVVDSVKYFNQTLTVDPSVFDIPKHVQCPVVPPDDVDDTHVETFSRLTGFRRSLL